jgi:hydrogenase maturation protease
MGVEASSGRDLLIGIGNPLRGDDGVGPLLLEELAQDWNGWRTASAELKAVHQLTPELALAVADVQRVLFVDACVVSVRSGPWIETLAVAGDPVGCDSLGSHQLAPATLVALAHTLYGWQGEGALLRVPAFAFPHGCRFSAPLKRNLPQARHLVRHWLQGG